MNLSTATKPHPFSRTFTTWAAYFMLAYVAFAQSLIGPLMPTLRSELNLSYTLGGLLPAGIATGIIITGLLGSWVSRIFSRKVLFWSSATGLAVSSILIALGHSFGLLLLAVVITGSFGSLGQVMVQAILVDEHGENRSIAITETMVAASLTTTLGPILISITQKLAWDWRTITYLSILFFIIFLLVFRQVHLPEAPHQPTSTNTIPGQGIRSGSLPFGYWVFWFCLVLMVSFEMSINVWSTDFFISALGFERAAAVMAFSAFPVSMLIGRFSGSFLSRTFPQQKLLYMSILVTLAGFILFAFTRLPLLNIIGLFITGLGVANQYSLTFSSAVNYAHNNINAASARASLAIGVALFSAPLLLGRLADFLSLNTVFGLIIILMAAALLIIFLNDRLNTSKNPLPEQK